METVNWDVAGTTANGINAANVRITLSTNSGQDFPIELAASVPNTGSATFTVPNNTPIVMTARVKVEATGGNFTPGNTFFDINNTNFAITAAPTAAGVSVSGRILSANGRGISNALVTVTDQSGAARTTRTNAFGFYRFSDVDAGQTYIFNVSHKRYRFSTRVTSITEDVSGFDFTANN